MAKVTLRATTVGDKMRNASTRASTNQDMHQDSHMDGQDPNSTKSELDRLVTQVFGNVAQRFRSYEKSGIESLVMFFATSGTYQ